MTIRIFNNSILLVLIVSLSLLFIGGCSDRGKITAKEVLDQNPDADFFQYNGDIYNNMTEVDWFRKEKVDLVKHNVIGEIKKQSTNSFGSKDFTATKLPEGTKIYLTSEKEKEDDVGILIVELEGKELFYMVLYRD